MADIATAMGRPRTTDISVARNESIKKGLVYAPERGLLAFTIPGMHELIAASREPRDGRAASRITGARQHPCSH